VKASRGGRWYARDPRVEERTHTPLHDEAKEGLTFGVPAHSLGKIRWLEWLSKVWVDRVEVAVWILFLVGVSGVTVIPRGTG